MATQSKRTIRITCPEKPSWNGDVKYKTDLATERAFANLHDVMPVSVRKCHPVVTMRTNARTATMEF